MPPAATPSDVTPLHSHARPHLAMHHDPEAAARALAAEEKVRAEQERRAQAWNARLYATGRVLLAGLFLVSAAWKAMSYEETRDALAPLLYNPKLLPLASIGVELLGGTMLLLGYRVRAAALGLSGYLVAVALLVPVSLPIEHAVALANLGFIGGLLLLAAHGAGRWSVDRLVARRTAMRAAL